MTIDKDDRDVYDLTRWKPVTFEQYLNAFRDCFLTVDGDTSEVTTKREWLPDGRMRLATYATCVVPPCDDVREVGDVPYLIMLANPDVDDPICFKRTDIELCD